MSTVDLIFAALAAFAAIGGFIFEWRRQSRQADEVAALEARVDAAEARLLIVESWRDRIGRSW